MGFVRVDGRRFGAPVARPVPVMQEGRFSRGDSGAGNCLCALFTAIIGCLFISEGVNQAKNNPGGSAIKSISTVALLAGGGFLIAGAITGFPPFIIAGIVLVILAGAALITTNVYESRRQRPELE